MVAKALEFHKNVSFAYSGEVPMRMRDGNIVIASIDLSDDSCSADERFIL